MQGEMVHEFSEEVSEHANAEIFLKRGCHECTDRRYIGETPQAR